MNKANLKSYAPKARLDFIKAVTERANVLGISGTGALPAEVRGDVAIIDGREWPAKVAGQREELLSRIKRHGFEQTMDEVAYTWFNRFAALRYMEIHDYLDHGWRVLSSRDGGLPEILRHASEVSLPGLNADRAREMQLAGNQDNELYKLLLVAQCNELSRVMPFLFERIDDDTELLLPENLLRTDSIVAKLVESVPEEDWQEIEVIGWLYQFYISEKKDQVIGKVVKSEDIPAATQLFTPNWIVQYLVQNSVGRLWLMANPTSTLASQWPYYIQPAEQTPEVQAQLDALIQTRVREDGETLNPETITVLDPACGSGHILVVAYDVMKAIYLERGYQPRTIPRLILEKNLYGLDIDDRAAQLAAFALLMKARADDRRLFADPPKHNVLSLKSSVGVNYEELCTHLNPFGVQRHTIWGLIEAFEHAKTFGSLIQIPYLLKTQLEPLTQVLAMVREQGDLYAQQAAKDLLPLVKQAEVLANQFDAVVANPPYIGSKFHSQLLKDFVLDHYSYARSDLFACFVERSLDLSKQSSALGIIAPFVWMFLGSYQSFRERLLRETSLASLIQLEYNAFEPAMVPVAAFTLMRSHLGGYVGSFIKLSEFKGHQNQSPRTLQAISDPNCGWMYVSKSDDFEKIPGSPIAYWVPPAIVNSFSGLSLGDICESTGSQNKTADDQRFVRLWHEVNVGEFLGTGRWRGYFKGGDYRKFYGNQQYVVDWSNEARNYYRNNKTSNILDERYWFRKGFTYSDITSGDFSARYMPEGFIYSTPGPSFHVDDDKRLYALLSLLNSRYVQYVAKILNPTLHFNVGDAKNIPVSSMVDLEDRLSKNGKRLVELSKEDWDTYETSWGFGRLHMLAVSSEKKLKIAVIELRNKFNMMVDETLALEVLNNKMLSEYYGLGDDFSCINDSDVSLRSNLAFRYGRVSSNADAVALFEIDVVRELISYAIGCMMGRYSLDEQGLIYAHAGNVGFDPSRYQKKFPADADGIVPLTDEPWFTDDAASRVREFLRAVCGEAVLEENMSWLAESLGVKGSETPDETIRRYLADKFFKDHLQTYKKRPIYWLFSSGKQGAFQALVYLHRYNEGTLARMRAEYVVPLIAKMVSRLDMLSQDVAASSSAASRTKLQKQIESLRKKQLELLAYDEKLRHYADMRITLDLDDGVKVNYGKFGDLLEGVKIVTGGASDD